MDVHSTLTSAAEVEQVRSLSHALTLGSHWHVAFDSPCWGCVGEGAARRAVCALYFLLKFSFVNSRISQC